MKSREALAKWMYDRGLKVGAEIGVEKGKYSEVLLQAGLEVYAIDAWEPYGDYREHLSKDKFERLYDATMERLLPYENVHIIRKFSMDAVNDFEDESLDFVYIDANHSFRYFIDDLDSWSKKVRKGGVVAGHDYKRYGGKYGLNSCHVKDAINAWAKAYKIELMFTDDDPPSWYHIK